MQGMPHGGVLLRSLLKAGVDFRAELSADDRLQDPQDARHIETFMMDEVRLGELSLPERMLQPDAALRHKQLAAFFRERREKC